MEEDRRTTLYADNDSNYASSVYHQPAHYRSSTYDRAAF
jgi:hypothetical protein